MRMGPTASKRIATGGGTYVEVSVARPPNAIIQGDWDRLGQINDQIIDAVTYDHARARSPMSGVQGPTETLQLRRGVCMDYAALFEYLARRDGYRVMSMNSSQLNHAWNVVFLSGSWWIVDVTWNAGDTFANGRPIPTAVRGDPDFRRRYFLTTLPIEQSLADQGLLQSTHAAPDATPIDYERTLEAKAIVDQIGAHLRLMNATVRRHQALVNEHNRLVARFNAASAPERGTLRGPLDRQKSELDKLADSAARSRAAAGRLHESFRALDATHPLGISFAMELT